MNISTETLEHIKRSESWVPGVYQDPVGLPTIGYGHLISRLELGLPPVKVETPETLRVWMAAAKARYPKPLTQAEGLVLLQKDVAVFEDVVNRLVKVPLNQSQFDALVDFSYNVGEPQFSGSTLLRKLNAKDYVAVPKELMRWTKARDPKTGLLKELAGLKKRRQAEVDLWNGK